MQRKSPCFCLLSNFCLLLFCYKPFPCFRDARNSRVALFDGIEEGGIRASSLYSSYNEIDEQDNERAMGGLQDRVSLLKRVSLIFLVK